MSDYVLLTAKTLAGLLAGVFFAYAVSMMPALRAMDDDTFLTVMNKINVVIVNPVFLAVFLGAPVAALAHAGLGPRPWAIAGAALAVVTLLVTLRVQHPPEQRPGRRRLARGVREPVDRLEHRPHPDQHRLLRLPAAGLSDSPP